MAIEIVIFAFLGNYLFLWIQRRFNLPSKVVVFFFFLNRICVMQVG